MAVASTPRRWLCASAVPIDPADVPITPEGLRANESVQGRLNQLIAFFRQPGIERLYSGGGRKDAVETEVVHAFAQDENGGCDITPVRQIGGCDGRA